MAADTRQTRRSSRSGRNTAPMWKKIAVVLSAPIAVVSVIALLNANTWNVFMFLALIIVVAAATVWGVSKLLGVRLSLGSWD